MYLIMFMEQPSNMNIQMILKIVTVGFGKIINGTVEIKLFKALMQVKRILAWKVINQNY